MREHYWRQAEHLQRESDLVYEMMPILYALVKSTKGDIDLAMSNINEGKQIFAVKRDKIEDVDFRPTPHRSPKIPRSPNPCRPSRNLISPPIDLTPSSSPNSPIDIEEKEKEEEDFKSDESENLGVNLSPVNLSRGSAEAIGRTYETELARSRIPQNMATHFYPNPPFDFRNLPTLMPLKDSSFQIPDYYSLANPFLAFSHHYFRHSAQIYKDLNFSNVPSFTQSK
jgi:hypothetical protein